MLKFLLFVNLLQWQYATAINLDALDDILEDFACSNMETIGPYQAKSDGELIENKIIYAEPTSADN